MAISLSGAESGLPTAVTIDPGGAAEASFTEADSVINGTKEN